MGKKKNEMRRAAAQKAAAEAGASTPAAGDSGGALPPSPVTATEHPGGDSAFPNLSASNATTPAKPDDSLPLAMITAMARPIVQTLPMTPPASVAMAICSGDMAASPLSPLSVTSIGEALPRVDSPRLDSPRLSDSPRLDSPVPDKFVWNEKSNGKGSHFGPFATPQERKDAAGKAGRAIALSVNHFGLKITRKEPVHHYDVKLSKKPSNKIDTKKKPQEEKLLRKTEAELAFKAIQQLNAKEPKVFGGQYENGAVAYDGATNMYICQKLVFPNSKTKHQTEIKAKSS